MLLLFFLLHLLITPCYTFSLLLLLAVPVRSGELAAAKEAQRQQESLAAALAAAQAEAGELRRALGEKEVGGVAAQAPFFFFL